ncbi:MAG: outer membrane beta-barrel protein [Chitinophagaceae bacterium]
MDKQHFDHIENRIRQAAENISPPFKDEAWKNMEMLLEKEHNRKRRGIIWWWPLSLFVLLTGSGLVYFLYNKDKNKLESGQLSQPAFKAETKTKGNKISGKSTLPKAERLPASTPNQHQTVPDNVEKTVDKTVEKTKEQVTGKQLPAIYFKAGQKPESTNGKREVTNVPIDKEAGRQKLTVIESEGDQKRVNKAISTPAKQEDKTIVDQPDLSDLPDTTTAKEIQPDIKSLARVDSLVNTGNKDSIENTAVKETVNKTKVKLDRFRPGLYFTASVATDASSINKWSADNRGAVYGGGIGYRFNKRFGLQTGFYAGRRLYTAGPGDYKVRAGSYWSMVQIMSIDADCYIYEIPLSLRYDLMQRNRFNVYTVGGVSSLIMKKEIYGYTYKRSGVDHWVERTYTGNKHYLSMANLSLGFEYKVLPAFYLQAEPYLKMPVAGIGEGKIKLYSSGVQAGIRYQPLKKKKNN